VSAKQGDLAATVGIEDMVPMVDFACRWRLDRSSWYRYRVPSHQFLLVESGSLRARTADGLIEGLPGDLILLRRLPCNEYGFDGETRFFEIHASFAPPPRTSAWLCVDSEPLPQHVRLGRRLAAAIEACDGMCRWIDHHGDLARLQVRRHLEQLLLAMVGDPPARARAASELDPWRRAREALEADLGASMTLADAARALRLSPDHFIRGFRRRFGVSPMAYRGQARLRRAASELAEGRDRDSIKRIARQLGFADASAFARAFRRQFGLTPSAWRVAEANAELPPTPLGSDAPGYALNRHLRPPEFAGRMFTWG
jgi:AraC-like DNA-binding protein